MADDGGAFPVLTREHFEAIRDRHRRHTKTRYDAEVLVREVERLHPEWQARRYGIEIHVDVEAVESTEAIQKAIEKVGRNGNFSWRVLND